MWVENKNADLRFIYIFKITQEARFLKERIDKRRKRNVVISIFRRTRSQTRKDENCWRTWKSL